MTLIGLGGLKGSGKDALADELVRNHGFVKLGMSDALLAASQVLDPYIPINTYEAMNGVQITGNCIRLSDLVRRVGYVDAKQNPEVRRFLQVLGTDFGRNMVDPEIWTNMMEKRIEETMQENENVVVTGVRFENEADMIANQGHLVWVDRPGLVADANSTHASETSIDRDYFNCVVDNSGTLEDLYALIPQLLEVLRDR